MASRRARRFSDSRREERLLRALDLAIVYSRDPILRWASSEEVEYVGAGEKRVRIRWADGELAAEAEESEDRA